VAATSNVGDKIRAIFWTLVIGAGAIEIVYEFKVEDFKPDCDMQKICSDYKTQRNACATAGNYPRCMQIKMGTANYSSAELYCSEDGALAYKPKKNLNIVSCSIAWGKAWGEDLLK
jgi:hypothetical protein